MAANGPPLGRNQTAFVLLSALFLFWAKSVSFQFGIRISLFKGFPLRTLRSLEISLVVLRIVVPYHSPPHIEH